MMPIVPLFRTIANDYDEPDANKMHSILHSKQWHNDSGHRSNFTHSENLAHSSCRQTVCWTCSRNRSLDRIVAAMVVLTMALPMHAFWCVNVGWPRTSTFFVPVKVPSQIYNSLSLMVFRQNCFADFAYSQQPCLSLCVYPFCVNVCCQIAKILKIITNKQSIISSRMAQDLFFSSLTFILKIILFAFYFIYEYLINGER